MRRGGRPAGDEGHGVPAGAGGAGAGEGAGRHEGQDREAAGASAGRTEHHPGKKGNIDFISIFAVLDVHHLVSKLILS